MKNFKKYLTFTNIIAIFSFIVLMLFFTPCLTFTNRLGGSTPDFKLNLFQATFGCNIALPIINGTDTVKLLPCAGLVLAFVFLILGIISSVGKNRIKWLGLVATAFYIASGVLVACAVPMVIHSNYQLSPMTYKIGYYGWGIAVATLICFSGFVAFIDFVASITKPKVQEVY